MSNNPNTPNTDQVNPKIKVTANQSKTEAANTAGAGMQKSEEHYRKIVDKAVNRGG